MGEAMTRPDRHGSHKPQKEDGAAAVANGKERVEKVTEWLQRDGMRDGRAKAGTLVGRARENGENKANEYAIRGVVPHATNSYCRLDAFCLLSSARLLSHN